MEAGVLRGKDGSEQIEYVHLQAGRVRLGKNRADAGSLRFAGKSNHWQVITGQWPNDAIIKGGQFRAVFLLGRRKFKKHTDAVFTEQRSHGNAHIL